MHNLLRDYNRRYYKNVTRIWVRAKWRLFRLWIAAKLLKLAFAISPDAKEAIESRMRRKW